MRKKGAILLVTVILGAILLPLVALVRADYAEPQQEIDGIPQQITYYTSTIAKVAYSIAYSSTCGYGSNVCYYPSIVVDADSQSGYFPMDVQITVSGTYQNVDQIDPYYAFPAPWAIYSNPGSGGSYTSRVIATLASLLLPLIPDPAGPVASGIDSLTQNYQGTAVYVQSVSTIDQGQNGARIVQTQMPLFDDDSTYTVALQTSFVLNPYCGFGLYSLKFDYEVTIGADEDVNGVTMPVPLRTVDYYQTLIYAYFPTSSAGPSTLGPYSLFAGVASPMTNTITYNNVPYTQVDSDTLYAFLAYTSANTQDYPLTYTFNWGDGSTTTESSSNDMYVVAYHRWSTSGDYTVQTTVTMNNGKPAVQGSASFYLDIEPQSTPSLSVGCSSFTLFSVASNAASNFPQYSVLGRQVGVALEDSDHNVFEGVLSGQYDVGFVDRLPTTGEYNSKTQLWAAGYDGSYPLPGGQPFDLNTLSNVIWMVTEGMPTEGTPQMAAGVFVSYFRAHMASLLPQGYSALSLADYTGLQDPQLPNYTGALPLGQTCGDDLFYFASAYITYYQNGTYNPYADTTASGVINGQSFFGFVSAYVSYWTEVSDQADFADKSSDSSDGYAGSFGTSPSGVLSAVQAGTTNSVWSVGPSPNPLNSTVEVDVRIDNASNIWGWTIPSVTWNASVLQLTRVVEGGFLADNTGGDTATMVGNSPSLFNNVNGTIDGGLSEAIEGNDLSTDTSGVLATLYFNVTGSGVADINLSGATLYANSTDTVGTATTANNATVNVIVPESITASADADSTISPCGTVIVGSGSNQTFTISADTGYQIANVAVDDQSQGPISSYTFYNVASNHTISVTSTIDTYPITATSDSNSAISPSGVTYVDYGASQTYTFAVNSGYSIANVFVDGVPQGPLASYTFTDIQAPQTISVSTTPTPLNIIASASAGGAISPSGTITLDYGANQAFTFTPNSGYYILDVLVDGVNQGAPSSFTFVDVQSPHTISVSFAPITYTITASADSHSGITPSGSIQVQFGNSQAFNIFANTGYHIVHVYVDGVDQGPITSYTFSNVNSNHAISVVSAIDTYTITTSADANSNLSPSNPTVNYGSSETITITADTGYQITHVYVDGVDQGPISSYTFNDVTASHTITCTSAVSTYTITTIVGTDASISPANVTVSYGGSQTFTISVGSGYTITAVYVDGVNQGQIYSYTFSDVVADQTISVTTHRLGPGD